MDKPILITDQVYHPIETYFNELFTSNIYIGEDSSHQNKCFMLLLPYPFSNDLQANLTKLNSISPYFIKSKSIFKKSENEYYIIYEYSHGIRLSDYIINAIPPIKLRLFLLSQLVEILISLLNNKIEIYDFNSDFCFVDGLDQPNIKMIYNVNGYVKSSSQNLEKEPVEKSNEFLWISRAIFIVTLYNKNYKKEKNDFQIFFSECSDSIKNSLKILFTKTFNKCKGIEEYSLNNFIQDFNLILSKCELNPIEQKTILNDTTQHQNVLHNTQDIHEKIIKNYNDKNSNLKFEGYSTNKKKIKSIRPIPNNQINQSIPVCQIVYPNNFIIPIHSYPLPYIQPSTTDQFVDQFRASLEYLNKFINIQTQNINQVFNQTQMEYNMRISSIRNNNLH